jgi:hypothetical protein
VHTRVLVPARTKRYDLLARRLSGWRSNARSRLRAAALVAILLALLAACSAEVARAPDYDVLAQAIEYGEDDRVDLNQAEQPFAQIARDTAIALIGPSQMRRLDGGNYVIEAPRYGDLQSLCPGERFFEQPAAQRGQDAIYATYR